MCWLVSALRCMGSCCYVHAYQYFHVAAAHVDLAAVQSMEYYFSYCLC